MPLPVTFSFFWTASDDARGYRGEKRAHCRERIREIRADATCGCVTHWQPTCRARNRMGVNFRKFDPSIIESFGYRGWMAP
jgi:hypothetical protein